MVNIICQSYDHSIFLGRQEQIFNRDFKTTSTQTFSLKALYTDIDVRNNITGFYEPGATTKESF